MGSTEKNSMTIFPADYTEETQTEDEIVMLPDHRHHKYFAGWDDLSTMGNHVSSNILETIVKYNKWSWLSHIIWYVPFYFTCSACNLAGSVLLLKRKDLIYTDKSNQCYDDSNRCTWFSKISCRHWTVLSIYQGQGGRGLHNIVSNINVVYESQLFMYLYAPILCIRPNRYKMMYKLHWFH